MEAEMAKKLNGKVRSNIGRYELVIRLCKGIQRNVGENQWVDICSTEIEKKKKCCSLTCELEYNDYGSF